MGRRHADHCRFCHVRVEPGKLSLRLARTRTRLPLRSSCCAASQLGWGGFEPRSFHSFHSPVRIRRTPAIAARTTRCRSSSVRRGRMGWGGFEPPPIWRLCQLREKPMTQSLEAIVPEEAVDQYLKSRGQDASESTIQNHRYRLKHFLKWCDHASIENLNERSGRDCENYKNWRIAQGDVADIPLEQQLRTFRVFPSQKANSWTTARLTACYRPVVISKYAAQTDISSSQETSMTASYRSRAGPEWSERYRTTYLPRTSEGLVHRPAESCE